MNLNLSKDLQLPVEFLSLRKVVYGGSGAGKTSTGRVIFEEATRAGVPCGVIDLKGDWWGLKSTADGKSEGHPVVIFGGDHQDVPIHENGGAELAEIVAELRQPFIIDLEQFSKGKQLKFLAPFFDRLYDKNREALVLICDEADRYIPQRMFSKDVNVAMCLGAGEDIAKRGRKHGIFPMFISQRNADLNKSVTELCEVALVFRTSGPNDQKAVNDWFEAKGNLVTEEQRALVMDRIAGLPDGRAIVCSAHPHMPMFKEVQMRLPETFDSSATPEIGKELIKPKKLARVELASLTDRMKATIEQAKANDPAELKRMLTAEKRRGNELEQALQKSNKTTSKQETKIETKEVPVLVYTELHHIKCVLTEFRSVQKSIAEIEPIIQKISQEILKFSQLTGKNKNHWTLPQIVLQAKRIGIPVPKKINSSVIKNQAPEDNYETVTGGLKRMMIALAQRPGLTKRQLGVRAGLSSTSGTFGTYLGKMRSSDWIEQSGDGFRLTDTGIEALGKYEPLPEGQDLLNYWLNDLGQSGAGRMLRTLAENYPNPMTKEELGAAAEISHTSGTFGTYLGKLKTLELVEGKHELLASKEFFE